MEGGSVSQINQPRKPVNKSGGEGPWMYRVVNSCYKVAVGCIPLGILYIVLAGIAGVFGGVGYKVFYYFFNLINGA